MIAVIDASIFIKNKLHEYKFEVGYTPKSVFDELRDENTRSYLSIHQFQVEVLDPSDIFLNVVRKLNHEKNLLLSSADIDIVALTLQLGEKYSQEWITKENVNSIQQVVCLSEDNGVIAALKHLSLHASRDVEEREWKIRCFTCHAIYDTVLHFCKKCGYNTLTRVRVSKTADGYKLHLKKNYNYKVKNIKDRNGEVIRSGDQKEYSLYLMDKKRDEKKLQKLMKEMANI
jgi:rRNA maturation endonuclease Nob1